MQNAPLTIEIQFVRSDKTNHIKVLVSVSDQVPRGGDVFVGVLSSAN